jgi:uncharacterized membrane protein (GlpM family)
VGSSIAEVALKAAGGGAFVLLFAALAQTLSPKRFAGILSAAPSVALAGLLVTLLSTGVADAAASLRGMAIGAAAFVGYCLATVPLCHRLGIWRGSSTALGVWVVVAAVGYVAVLA